MRAVAIRRETAPASAFDYSALPRDLAKRTRERAARIKNHHRLSVQSFGAMGDELVEARAELEHGFFLRWIEEEIGISKSGAYRAIDVAERIGGKLPALGNMPLTVVQAIAAGSTPEPVRTEVIQLVADREAAGEKVDPKVILERVKTGAAEARQAEKLAKLTPEQRKGLGQKAKRARRTAEQREKQRQEEQSQRELADLSKYVAAYDVASAILAEIPAEKIRTALEALPPHSGHIFLDLLHERVGKERPGYRTGIREYQRLTIRAENRERVARGEPELPFPWDPPAAHDAAGEGEE